MSFDSIQSLLIKFGVKDDGTEAGFKKIAKGNKDVEDSFDRLNSRAKSFADTLKTAILGGGIIWGLKSIGSAAIEAGETTSKFGVVFSDVMEDAGIAVNTLVNDYDLAEVTSKKLLSSTGDVLTGFGFLQDEAIELSKSANVLAADLASLQNIEGGVERASEAITSAMVGQTEKAQALGIVIRQDSKEYTDLVKRFMEVEGRGLLQAKALAALTIATNQSKNAIGDYARTQDSAANTIRAIEEKFKDLKVSLGQTITENEVFNTTLSETKSLFESESFKSGIKSIVGEVADLAINIAAVIPLSISLLDTWGRLQKQTAVMADEFGVSFKKMWTGLREVGVSAETLNEAIDKIDENNRLGELTDRQRDLTKIIKESNETLKESKPLDIAYEGAKVKIARATKQLAKVEEEKNAILSFGLQKIIKNNEAYGISNEQVELLRKRLRGEVEEKIKVEKANKAIIDTTIKISTEVKKSTTIFRSYDDSLDAVADGIEGMEESLKNYDYMVAASTDNIEGMVQAEKDVAEATEKANEELQRLIEKDIEKTTENMGDGFMGLKFDLAKLIKELKDGNSNIGEFGVGMAAFTNVTLTAAGAALKLMDNLDRMSSKVSDTVDIVGDAIQAYGQGGYAGAIASVWGNSDKLANVLWGVGDSVSNLNRYLEESEEILKDVAGASDEAAQKLSLFLDQVAKGNYELGEFNQYLEDTDNFFQSGGGQWNYGISMTGGDIDLDDTQRQLEQLQRDVAGTDPGAIAEAMKTALTGLSSYLKKGADTQKEFNDMTTLTLSTFARLRKGGMSTVEALRAMDDSFAKLAEIQRQGAASSNEYYQELLGNNKDLINSVDKYAESIRKSGDALTESEILEKTKDIKSQYNDLIEAGFSHNEALNLVAPSLEAIQKNAEKYGTTLDDNTLKFIEQAEAASQAFDADPIFAKLAHFQEMIKTNQALVDSMEGFNTMISATASLGKMSQEEVKAYGSELQRMLEDATKAGFSNEEALQLMLPTLEALKTQAEDYGLELDENTKALIDQAEAAGMFEGSIDPLEKIGDILEKIFIQLGGSADELEKFGAAATKSSDEAEEGLKGVTDKFGEMANQFAAEAAVIGSDVGAAAAAGVEDMLKQSGIADFDLAQAIPDIGVIEIDTGQMEDLLEKATRDDKEPITVVEGDRAVNVEINPRTIDGKELLKEIKNNIAQIGSLLKKELE